MAARSAQVTGGLTRRGTREQRGHVVAGVERRGADAAQASAGQAIEEGAQRRAQPMTLGRAADEQQIRGSERCLRGRRGRHDARRDALPEAPRDRLSDAGGIAKRRIADHDGLHHQDSLSPSTLRSGLASVVRTPYAMMISTLYVLTAYRLRRTMYGVKTPDSTGDRNEMADDQTGGSLPWWPSPDARRAAQAERRRARRQGGGSQRPGRSRERTTAEEIVATAVRIIDRDGLDALTIRRLASELGVAAMTVYSYVRSKDELLDLVVDGVAGGVALPPGDGDWRRRAEALAHSLRTALLAHPEGARLISERPIQSPNAFRIFDAGLGIFRDAGFPDEQAAEAYFAFGNYVMGCVAQDTAGIRVAPRSAGSEAPTGGGAAAYIQQLPEDQFPNIKALAHIIYGPSGRAAEPDAGSGPDASSRRFDFGLDSLLDGLAARLDR